MPVKKLPIWLMQILCFIVITYSLKKFLNVTTLNVAVNNWGIQSSDYCIKSIFIKEIKNILVDTLSDQIDQDFTETNPLKRKSYEYSYSVFGPLPSIDKLI